MLGSSAYQHISAGWIAQEAHQATQVHFSPFVHCTCQ